MYLMLQYQAVKKSGNAKIGPIFSSTTSRLSCPPACPLSGKGGCYAESGFYTRSNWDKVDSKDRGTDFPGFLAQVEKVGTDVLWRHNVAGDLPPETPDVISKEGLRALVAANGDSRGFTYTHYPLTKHNVSAIKEANDKGFTINLSANTVKEARTLRKEHNLPTVALVEFEEYWKGEKRRGDVVRCPAEYLDNVSCATCKLCAQPTRKDIVGFTVHGGTSKAAAIIARG